MADGEEEQDGERETLVGTGPDLSESRWRTCEVGAVAGIGSRDGAGRGEGLLSFRRSLIPPVLPRHITCAFFSSSACHSPHTRLHIPPSPAMSGEEQPNTDLITLTRYAPTAPGVIARVLIDSPRPTAMSSLTSSASAQPRPAISPFSSPPSRRPPSSSRPMSGKRV